VQRPPRSSRGRYGHARRPVSAFQPGSRRSAEAGARLRAFRRRSGNGPSAGGRALDVPGGLPDALEHRLDRVGWDRRAR